MLVFWPWAQSDPIAHPLQRARLLLARDHPVQDPVRRPALIPASDLPWEYLPTYIVLALPELVLVLLLAAPSSPASRWRGGGPGRSARVLPLLHARLHDRLPGGLRDRDQGGAVRRHAPFHLRAAADRGRRGAGRRHRPAPARRFALPQAGLRRARPLRPGACLGHGDAAPRPIRLLQRLRRRRRRGREQVQARLLGQFLCRGGARPGDLSAQAIRRRFRGARVHRRGLRAAGLGAILFSAQFPLGCAGEEGRFLHRLHQGRLPSAA